MYNDIPKYRTNISFNAKTVMCVHQEEEIKELELQLDIRAKDLKTQEAMLFSQVLLSKIRWFWGSTFFYH